MKSWSEKLDCVKKSQKKVLAKSVAGMSAGSLMYISTPKEIEKYISNLPIGEFVTVQQMRADLAKNNQADCTCPLTTGIYLRIVAEAAYENNKNKNMAPFWRVIAPNSSIAKKLSFDSDFITHKRTSEINA